MHDQSASRISGRTRAAVSAMCVRALRITVLKSAGNFTRHECHNLNAEKTQRVKCYVHELRNFWRASNFRTLAWPAAFENFRLWSIVGSDGLLRHVRSTRKQTPIGRVDVSAGGPMADIGQLKAIGRHSQLMRTARRRRRSLAAARGHSLFRVEPRSRIHRPRWPRTMTFSERPKI